MGDGKMCDFTTDEMRTYAPAETPDLETEGFPQLTTADTGWTDKERESMRERGFDDMDMLRAWLS